MFMFFVVFLILYLINGSVLFVNFKNVFFLLFFINLFGFLFCGIVNILILNLVFFKILSFLRVVV